MVDFVNTDAHRLCNEIEEINDNLGSWNAQVERYKDKKLSPIEKNDLKETREQVSVAEIEKMQLTTKLLKELEINRTL